ncbi:uncharacterized protein LOC115359819 [Myripristis murdjan]|uniref:uncharacterized protein LOC115359819 n=1 Tax=Myripristis murdjan TaxID=586833 RepID=UPI001175E0A6|nr:uncharacterized protein LOC115359819 [Myripristis murdjan]
MMLLLWSGLQLCLCVSAGNTARVKAGGSVTIECSTAGCSNCASHFTGMFLYKDLEQQEEVFYYHPPSSDTDESKVTPTERFQNRVQTLGSFTKLSITISNLSVNDTGVYTCVYHQYPDNINALCKVHLLTVYENGQKEFMEESTHFATEESPFHTTPSQAESTNVHPTKAMMPYLVYTIIFTCVITIVVTMIVILLIIPRVKKYIESRGGGRPLPQVPNDYVYEEMGRNGFRHLNSSTHP